MRSLILLSFYCFSLCFCFAQKQKQIDSLKNGLATAQPDSHLVLRLAEIGDRYRNFNIDSANYFDQRAITLARQIKFPKGEVQSLRYLAFAYRFSGNTPKALEIHFKTLKLAKLNNLKREEANILNQIGTIYSEEHDYAKAFYFLKESSKLCEAIHYSTMLGLNQNVLGRTYGRMNQLDSALYYCLLASKNLNKDIPELFTINSRDIGLIYSKKGDKKRALAYFKNSLKLMKPDQGYETWSQSNYQIALVYQQNKQLDSSIYFANVALDYAQRGNFYSRIIEASRLLSKLYESKDVVKALQYSNMAIIARDSLYSKGKRNAIQNLTDFDERERQYELETAETTYKNQIRQYALLASLGVFLLIAFILYRNNLREKKAKKLLQEQKDQVESTLSELRSTQTQLIQKEKLASLGELTAGIAHEIQNPLNFVNNFSELSVGIAEDLKEELKNSPLTPDGGIIIEDTVYFNELISDLSQNQEKINHHGKRASSIVKGMLEHSRMGTGERVLTDFNALCDEYLRLSYHGMKAKNKDFQADYELIADPNLPKINVVPQDMGRVLLNLINNAFYAIRTVESPKVTVTTLHSDKQLIIKVQDNGNGIPADILPKIFQPFFTTKPTGEGTGLGLSLSYDIVTKGHGGTLEVESVEGEGTTFTIKI